MTSKISDPVGHELLLMRGLRFMFCNQVACDFEVIIGDKSFQAHKAVLIACSDYFRALFESGMKESSEGFAKIGDISSKGFNLVLDYMYQGEAAVTDSNVQETLHAADMLQFTEFRDKCIHFLEENIRVKNCLQVKKIAEKFGASKLASFADQYVMENFRSVVQTSEFKSLELPDMLELLKKSREKIETTWQAAMNWIHSQTAEETFFLEVFQFFSFEECCFKFLFEKVWKESLVVKTESCKQTVALIITTVLTHDQLEASSGFEILKMMQACQADFEKKEMLIQYIADNFDQMHDDPMLTQIDASDMVKVFQLADWHKNFEKLWAALITWVKAKRKERKNHLHTVLENGNFRHTNFDFLYNVVLQHSLIKTSPKHLSFAVAVLFESLKVSSVTASNWFILLQLSREYGTTNSDNATKTFSFIVKNFPSVTENKNFNKLLFDELVKLIQAYKNSSHWIRDKFYNQSYLCLWPAVKSWIEHDKVTRTTHLKQILQEMNLRECCFDFLFRTLKTDSLLEFFPGCLKLISEAIFVKLAMLPDCISSANGVEIVRLSRLHPSENAKKARVLVFNFLIDNDLSINQMANFAILFDEDFLFMLEFSSSSPEEKWKASLEWVKVDSEQRKKTLPTILHNIKLKNFTHGFIQNNVFAEDLVKESEECKTMLIEVLLKKGGGP